MVERKGVISGDDLDETSSVDSWPLPSLNQRGKVVRSAHREREERAKELVENVGRAARPRHLTAEEINRISKQAEEEGFKAGYEEGFSKGEIQGEKKGRVEGEARAYQETKTRLEDEYARLQAICDRLSEPMQMQDQALEQMLLDMARHFASQLLQKEIEQHPESLRAIIVKVIQALPAGAKNMSIFLHPDDAELMQKHLQEKNQQWPIQTDEALSRGGCRVETRESIVDYSVEKRWLSLLDHLSASMESSDANHDEQ